MTKARHQIAARQTRLSFREITTAIADRVGSALRSYANRRQITKLRALDERGLHDIGLTRADVDRALLTPWYDDPSAALASAQRARRLNRFII
ncbi:MAG: DUF1127 domain-containing protein [Pseudomonadota bacterium]